MKKEESFKKRIENAVPFKEIREKGLPPDDLSYKYIPGHLLYIQDKDVIKLRELKIQNKQKEVVYISRKGKLKFIDIVDAKYQQKEMKEHIDKTFQQYIRKYETRKYTEEESNIAKEIIKNMKPIEEYEDESLYYKEYDDKLKEANIPPIPVYVFNYVTDNPTYKFTPDMFEFREEETNRLLKYKNMEELEKFSKEKAKQLYEDGCNAYLQLFCEKHEFDFEDAKDCWVSGDVGGITECGDYFVDMQTIKDDIELDAEEDAFFKWYDYCLRADELGLNVPNFKSFIKGCPITSEETFAKLESIKNELKNLIEQENGKMNSIKN